MVTVDNIDPMPDLLFVNKSISVQVQHHMQSHTLTFLEVRATIKNSDQVQPMWAVGGVGRRDEYIIPNIDSGRLSK